MQDSPEKCDVIIIPGSANWEHVVTAAEMYKKGYAQVLVPCGRYSYKHGRFLTEKLQGTPYEGDYETEAAYYRHILTCCGVPDHAILCEDRSQNTFENAKFARELLTDRGIRHDKIMLCCKAFHARRAFMTFERYFPESEFLVIPTVTHGIDRDSWYGDEKKFKIVMEELEKCGKFFNDMFPLIPQKHEACK